MTLSPAEWERVIPQMGPDTCAECQEVIGPKENSYEWGKDYICQRCHERHIDEGEARFDSCR